MDGKQRKIAIVTLQFYNNFGSVLQAYALRKRLQTLTNAQVDILPYRPKLPEYTYFQTSDLQKQYQEKCEKFAQFRKEVLGMEEGELCSSDNVSRYMQMYDALVVGSDIVWGKEFSGLEPVYFLQGAGEKSRKVAYACSVILDEKGRTEADALFAERMCNFDAVAVRETSAVESIQRFTTKQVISVLDPTLLLGQAEYQELVVENEKMKERPYLLSYFLTHDPAVVNYSNLLAKKLGLSIVHYFADYPDRVFDGEAGCFAFAGPGEFLGYVKNATCIFTNSFHGTCFSMIYRKPFYTYMAKRAMLSRVRDTVGRLGMEDRFFYDFRQLDKVNLEIDYSEFERRLQREQAASIQFLKNVLEVETIV